MNRVKGCDQPRLFHIGERYAASEVACAIGIPQTNYQNTVYNPSGHEAAIISAVYKNGLASVLTAQEGTNEKFGDGDILFVNGIGGSAMELGSYRPDLKKHNNLTTAVRIPAGQSAHEPINKVFLKMVKNDPVIAIFSDHRNFHEDYKARPPRKRGKNARFSSSVITTFPTMIIPRKHWRM